MTRNERMPFSAIVDSFSQGGGIWAFIGGLFMTLCYVVVGLFGINTKGKIARDENLAQRENALIQHLVDEVSRLNALVGDLDIALKAQANQHATELRREREECNAKMAAIKAELEILKRRMTSEEQR